MKLFLASILAMIPALCSAKDIEIKLLQTSDIHGNLFPENFITMTPASGGMARIYSLVKEYRTSYGDKLILLDNGDILQGQPAVYYYNYVDTVSTHAAAAVMNYMGYDAGNVGNHDVETGRKVLDRWAGECNMPILGANIINEKTGEPHFQPYKVFDRDGLKIAVLGMITPAIPVWLSHDIWEGLRFDDMEETARKWIPIIKEREKPHIIIGLFHAGKSGKLLAGYKENPSIEIAQNVPGFDIILFGHDHQFENQKICNVNGDSVLVMNPANTGQRITDITIKATLDNTGNLTRQSIVGELNDVNRYTPDEEFMSVFSPYIKEINDFVSEPIGIFTDSVGSEDTFFGPSKLVDLVHELQLEASGADISFAAPISYDASIKAGPIHMNDMFSLYKYENSLYIMELTGKEVKDYLEFSYSLWTDQMKNPDDHLLLFKEKKTSGESMRSTLVNPPYNFDSAAGIRYTVDVTKPKGEKITIISMADGTPFDYDKTYKIAVSSYRGNGGGEHFTKGVGISPKQLPKRIQYRSDKDLRKILSELIRKKQRIQPHTLDSWKFIPEDLVAPAAERDAEILFPKH